MRTIVAFTSSNTWTILKSNNLAPFKSGMNQLCKNIMGHLVQKGFFEYLRVNFYYNKYIIIFSIKKYTIPTQLIYLSDIVYKNNRKF